VFNCTGLGSRALFGDQELVPVKGQLTFLIPQPEVQYAVLNGELYMFPRSDGILLGGTHEENVWSLDPDAAAKERILAGHRRFFDGYRSCARP
jgi:D-amino-acid oxidase